MRWHSSGPQKPYLMLLPGLAVVLIVTCYGLWLAVLESLNSSAHQGLFYNYLSLLKDRIFIDSFFFSCRVAVISTLSSLVLGLCIAKLLDACLLNKKWEMFAWAPMVVPHFVAAYLIFLFFSQSGWLSGLAYQLNLVKDPVQFPILVKDRAGWGIIMTYIWKEVPFVLLMLLPVFQQINPRYRDVVRTLGGGPWHVFQTVEWPWLLPVVLESGIILFSFILAAFEVPYLIGVTHPKMISVLVYQWFFQGNWEQQPRAMAAIVLTSLLVLLITVIYFSLLQRVRFRIMKGR